MNFVAVDVETANSSRASICSIGVASFSDGKLVDEFYTLLNPQTDFYSHNIQIHGITEADVANAPTFADISEELFSRFAENIVVSHSSFDRGAIEQSTERFDISLPELCWLDSAQVARRTWAECARRGYGLANLCSRIGYLFHHHNALEDAKAAGHVLLAAMHHSGLGLHDWVDRVTLPLAEFHGDGTTHVSASTTHRREGNVQGGLYGEVVVFTGNLAIPRQQAADIAAAVGCDVRNSVTGKTTMLVVGDADAENPSSKVLKAQANGVRCVSELAFFTSALKALEEQTGQKVDFSWS